MLDTFNEKEFCNHLTQKGLRLFGDLQSYYNGDLDDDEFYDIWGMSIEQAEKALC